MFGLIVCRNLCTRILYEAIIQLKYDFSRQAIRWPRRDITKRVYIFVLHIFNFWISMFSYFAYVSYFHGSVFSLFSVYHMGCLHYRSYFSKTFNKLFQRFICNLLTWTISWFIADKYSLFIYFVCLFIRPAYKSWKCKSQKCESWKCQNWKYKLEVKNVKGYNVNVESVEVENVKVYL